ncbi:putative pentatricopeptide [Rosa chinensis]|uniref:Putative pentatricopeptide n=1 Tax=Rosa chinensis TaxID=74649 RepID=A0A2P6RBX0_ROSCH|nr:putative pentatricopeptide [Rosa chinensis]
MVTGFSQNLRFSESFKAFSQMRIAGESPTQFAFASVIRACVVLGSVEIGRQLHSLALKLGLACELFVGSNLADMYSKCGFMVEACKFFMDEQLPSTHLEFQLGSCHRHKLLRLQIRNLFF